MTTFFDLIGIIEKTLNFTFNFKMLQIIILFSAICFLIYYARKLRKITKERIKFLESIIKEDDIKEFVNAGRLIFGICLVNSLTVILEIFNTINIFCENLSKYHNFIFENYFKAAYDDTCADFCYGTNHDCDERFTSSELIPRVFPTDPIGLVCQCYNYGDKPL